MKGPPHQALADIDESDLAQVLIDSCPTRIFLPNPRAAEVASAAIYGRFGLNARQIALIATAPSVEYRVTRTDGSEEVVDNPADLPEAQKLERIEEPYFKLSIITPSEYTGTLMDLCQTRRGEMKKMEYLSPERVELVYELPLAEVVVDFFDQMKSRTKGYASLDYELSGYRPMPITGPRPSGRPRTFPLEI